MADPLQALLSWVANESQDFTTCHVEHPVAYTPRCGDCEADTRFSTIRRAWLDAGCPGVDFGPKLPPPPTTRVRIAVVQKGPAWAAAGFHDAPKPSARDQSNDPVNVAWGWLYDGFDEEKGCPTGKSEVVHWVEAVVPAPPEAGTFEGRVST